MTPQITCGCSIGTLHGNSTLHFLNTSPCITLLSSTTGACYQHYDTRYLFGLLPGAVGATSLCWISPGVDLVAGLSGGASIS